MGPAHKRHYAGRLGTNFQQITPFFSNALHPSVRIVCRHCRRLDVDPVAHLEGSVRAEERRNWLKVPSRPAPTAFPKTRSVSVSPFPETSYRYRLGPGDKLVMSVFKIDGYEASVQVLSDGTINLPRLGTWTCGD